MDIAAQLNEVEKKGIKIYLANSFNTPESKEPKQTDTGKGGTCLTQRQKSPSQSQLAYDQIKNVRS